MSISYELATRQTEPHTKIVGEMPDMRLNTAALVTNVLVNNHSEVNASLATQP